jgi:ketosteroid isomerase-like protein
MKGGALDLVSSAQEWIAAWNAHDLERILAHYADDVELDSPLVAKLMGGSEGVVRGKAALRDYFARGLQAFPTLRFDFIRLYAGVRSCVLEYRSANGLRAAEVMEFDGEGKVRRVLAHYCEEAMEVGHPSMKDLKRYI